MTQLVLPQTIDAGTAITATEHQQNYDAIKAVINGGIEGGPTVDGNIKANGVTAREVEDNLLADITRMGTIQAGVFTAADLKITPGAGLVLNYAAGTAWIFDTSGVISALNGTLIPAVVSPGATVTIGANASGNPRIDQVILTLTGYATGTVSVLAGTASVGATLANRTGAAALPASAIRLADVLVTNGFAGPFVADTSLRDRRPWARGFYNALQGDGAADVSVVGAAVSMGQTVRRVELSGAPVRVTLSGRAWNAGAGNTVTFQAFFDGVDSGAGIYTITSPAAAEPDVFTAQWTFLAGNTGSHLLAIGIGAPAGTGTLANSGGQFFWVTYEEIVKQNANNGLA